MSINEVSIHEASTLEELEEYLKSLNASCKDSKDQEEGGRPPGVLGEY